ncbi:MAG: hypothetical protein AAF889_00250 [Cyanobacteria bacterium P01_D01_bin.73]
MDQFDIEVDGVVIAGHGVASGRSPQSPYPESTIALQKPHFKAGGLDLDGYFEGTLNISISPRNFKLIQPRHTFPLLRWTELHPPETFSFVRCQIQFQNGEYDGWIYYPHPETKAVHFQDASTLEAIAVPIPRINYGDPVTLRLCSQEIGISDA